MNTEQPTIFLSQGLEIGYQSTLATTGKPVVMENGTHFLLARNGRGKTTLLRTLAGSIKPRAGELRTRGFLQYMPEDLRFDGEITPELIFRAMLPKNRRVDATALAKKIELDIRKPYARLSTGNRRKTSLIAAEFSIHSGKENILLLDEPFSGLDAFARQAFEELWQSTGENVLRLVSCHPDYDSMSIPNAIIIEGGSILQTRGTGQTWSQLKSLLN